MRLTTLLSTSFFIGLAFTSRAQPGSPSSSFGASGFASSADEYFGRHKGMVVQPDGKVVVVGFDDQNEQKRGVIARYLPSGLLDPSFNGSGFVFQSSFVGSTEDVEYLNVARASDGKLVVCGVEGNNVSTRIRVVRYTANGTLDQSFGLNGTISINSGLLASANEIAILPNGKIMMAGKKGSSPVMGVLVRLNADGWPDETFGGGDGILDFTFNGSNCVVRSMTVQPDGKLLVVADAYEGGEYLFAVARFIANGSFDNGFGVSGIASTTIGEDGYGAMDLALRPDGRMVIVGSTVMNSTVGIAMAQFLPNGTLDPDFGDGGTVVSLAPSSFDWNEDALYARQVVLEPTGRIIVCAYNDFPMVLARYEADGTVDEGFGEEGFAYSNFWDAQYQSPEVMTLSSDNRIYVAGYGYSNFSENNPAFVARFNTGINVGLEEVSAGPVLYAHPNPTHGLVQVTMDQEEAGAIELSIFDMHGRAVPVPSNFLSAPMRRHSTILDMSGLAAGTYTIRAVGRLGTAHLRLVKD
jgi:uncharacterized delta-60 repeat protein